MKHTVKTVVGAVIMFVGLAGILLGIAAVFYTWRTAHRLNREIPAALTRVDAVADSIGRQGEATVALIDATRRRVQAIREPIEVLSHRTEQQLTTASILDTLDERIEQRLSSAQEFTLSMQHNLRSMSGALLLLDSLPFFGPRTSPEGGSASRWKAIAATLEETADLLEQVSQAVARIHSGQSVTPQQLAQVRDVLEEIDQKFDKVQSDVRWFNAKIDRTRARGARIREAAPKWINMTAAAVMVFFVCFTFSQLSLLVHGWHWMMGRAGARREG